jgi:hypothetical protein
MLLHSPRAVTLATPVSTAAYCSVLIRRANPAAVIEPNPAPAPALGPRYSATPDPDWVGVTRVGRPRRGRPGVGVRGSRRVDDG